MVYIGTQLLYKCVVYKHRDDVKHDARMEFFKVAPLMRCFEFLALMIFYKTLGSYAPNVSEI